MFENMLYASTEMIILLGILIIFLNAFISKSTSNRTFQIAKSTILISAFFAVLFYNKSFCTAYFQNSAYIVLSYVLTTFLMYIWLSLSAKSRLALKDISQIKLCINALSILLLISVFMKSFHFVTTFLSLSGIICFQFLLFCLSKPSEELYHTGRRYGIISLFLLLLMAVSIYLLRGGDFSYQNAAEYLVMTTPLIKMTVIIGVLCMFLFLIGAAPFHFWLSDSISPVVLPIATYFSIVPLLAFWSVFFSLNAQFFAQSADHLSQIYFGFGALSVICGALGANSSRFLRKIFAFIGLYHTGVILLLMSTLKLESLSSCYIYLEIYLILMLGVYICFYTFKTNGTYVSTINDLEGIASMRPYVSSAFLFLILSLAGFPPLMGFVMQYAALSKLGDNMPCIYLILGGSFALLPVFIKILQSVYILPRKDTFDRVDAGLYFYLLVYMGFVLALMIKPNILLFQTDIIYNIG